MFAVEARMSIGTLVAWWELDTTLSWPPGEMASRLTTNQEIAGSTPAVVILFLFTSVLELCKFE